MISEATEGEKCYGPEQLLNIPLACMVDIQTRPPSKKKWFRSSSVGESFNIKWHSDANLVKTWLELKMSIKEVQDPGRGGGILILY